MFESSLQRNLKSFLNAYSFGKERAGAGAAPQCGGPKNPQAQGAAARASSSLTYQETAERKQLSHVF